MRCIVYKSLKQPDYYLFVAAEEGLARVPQGLKQLLGNLEQVLELELDGNRPLAQADPVEVVTQIREQGYYLQMPPRADAASPVC